MDERTPKRSKQQQQDADGSAVITGPVVSAGCRLRVSLHKPYVFLGQPFEVQVQVLDEDDVVQPTTVDVSVSVVGENKVCFMHGHRRKRRFIHIDNFTDVSTGTLHAKSPPSKDRRDSERGILPCAQPLVAPSFGPFVLAFL